MSNHPDAQKGDQASPEKKWGGVIVPEPTPAAFGLGLCAAELLLKSEEIAELESDIARLSEFRTPSGDDLRIFLV